jgi:carbohydrate diacid regulator
MLEVSNHFVQIASAVTNTIAELLYAPVVVTNNRGIVISSSEPDQIGIAFDAQDQVGLKNSFRIPIHHEAEKGEVIVGESHNASSISPQLAHALVELVINQTTLQGQLANQHVRKNQLINDLLHHQIEDETVVLNRAKQLGIDLTPPRAVILIDATDYIYDNSSSLNGEIFEVEQRRRITNIISSIISFFHLPNDTICADLGQGKVCVLKASDTKNLDLWVGGDTPKRLDSSWANLSALKRAADALRLRLEEDTGSSISIGIGRYHPGIKGIARSYEDARTALALGSRLQKHNPVYCLAELGIAAFVGVADEGAKIDLAKYLLSPLDHETELLATINAFFAENCCSSSTAKRLYIHRNTLSYRLDKIESLTGLDPRRFDDAVQIRLSLLLRSLNQGDI